VKLTLGTRGSLLARTQSEQVAGMLRERGHEVALTVIVTRGDREQSKPVPELGGKGLFTVELEQALRDGSIDLAVHSLKDLPTDDTDGVAVVAIPPREDPRDALVARGRRLDDLPPGARVGTASLRRRALLASKRPDLEIAPLRGNVDTRLGKVASGELDAVILAAAGLHRIDRKDVIDEYLAFPPAPAQGALGIQASTAAAAEEVRAALLALHDAGTARHVLAERTMLAALGGGCSVPVGGLAQPVPGAPGVIRLHGVVAAPDGSSLVAGEMEDGDPVALGRAVARALVEQGAKEILDAAR